MKKYINDNDLTMCALNGNRENLCRKMEQAEKQHQMIDTSAWLHLVAVWKVSFNDDKKAIHCLEKAELVARRSTGLVECALWYKVLVGYERARKCLEDGSYSSDGHELLKMACAWKSVFSDDIKAAECFTLALNATKKEQEPFKLLHLLEKVITTCDDYFKDDEIIRTCLIRMEELAASIKRTNGFYYCLCARYWFNCLQDVKKTNECLEKGYISYLERLDSVVKCNISDGVDKIHFLVLKWVKFIGSPETGQHLLESTDCACSTADWIELAVLWDHLFKNEERTRWCLDNAQLVAKNSEHWLDCHEMWIELFPNDDNVKFCLDQSEKLTYDDPFV